MTIKAFLWPHTHVFFRANNSAAAIEATARHRHALNTVARALGPSPRYPKPSTKK